MHLGWHRRRCQLKLHSFGSRRDTNYLLIVITCVCRYTQRDSRIHFTSNTFSILKWLSGFQLSYSCDTSLPPTESISQGYCHSSFFLSSDESSILITANCACSRGGQSSFRSFLLDPSRRTIGLGGNQKDETPSFAYSDCVALPLSFVSPRVSRLAPLFSGHAGSSAYPLEAEKYTGVERAKQTCLDSGSRV